jgi:superfamily I DNA and/or RNA helicase
LPYWREQTVYAIEDLLEIKRCHALLSEGKAEDVFVKNLEYVQGDEVDVIFVSIGYGPHAAGARLESMAFGPVSAYRPCSQGPP